MEDFEKLTIAQYKCLTSMEFYTRYMFKKMYGKKFNPQFFHIKICEALDRVFRGECTRLIINIPPRYSKTEIAVKLFISKGFAMNPASKFLHLSYSDDLALDNSQFTRDYVLHDEYQKLFPNVKLRKESNSKKKWYTTNTGVLYATSTGGQVTGFGAGVMDDEDGDFSIDYKENVFSGAVIVDDPIKPEDADSDIKRELINQRFTTTIKTRLNSMNTPIIVIMQRLHERDLAGYLIGQGGWEVLSFPVFDDSYPEGVLWPAKHSKEYLLAEQSLDPFMFERQYMQNPQPKEGRMYGQFSTYSVMPITKRADRKCYIDVADKGKDYLCAICYIETEIGFYVIDMVYTQLSSQNTEPLVVDMLARNNIKTCYIESNAGGEIYGRNVKEKMRLSGNWTTEIKTFFNSQNKQTRILNNAAEVSNMIIFPEGWQFIYPQFHGHITSYRRTGQNAFDDSADTLTGIIEQGRKGSSLLVFGAMKHGQHRNR